MKSIFILLFSIFLSTDIDKQSASKLNGDWTLYYFQDLTKGTKQYRPSEYSSGILTFTFSDNGTNGQLAGYTTTNKVRGEYLLDNDKIEVIRFGGTKINEHGWGSDFWTTISNSTSYNLEQDTLSILFDKDSKVMVFYKVDIKK